MPFRKFLGSLVSGRGKDKAAELEPSTEGARQYGPGDVIGGEFRVERVFGGEGKSGMGVVYLVSSRDAPDAFVLKTVQPTSRDSAALSRFAKEAQVWVSIGWHPNIVRAFWVRIIEDVLYIAAEYVAPVCLSMEKLTMPLT